MRLTDGGCTPPTNEIPRSVADVLEETKETARRQGIRAVYIANSEEVNNFPPDLEVDPEILNAMANMAIVAGCIFSKQIESVQEMWPDNMLDCDLEEIAGMIEKNPFLACRYAFPDGTVMDLDYYGPQLDYVAGIAGDLLRMARASEAPGEQMVYLAAIAQLGRGVSGLPPYKQVEAVERIMVAIDDTWGRIRTDIGDPFLLFLFAENYPDSTGHVVAARAREIGLSVPLEPKRFLECRVGVVVQPPGVSKEDLKKVYERVAGLYSGDIQRGMEFVYLLMASGQGVDIDGPRTAKNYEGRSIFYVNVADRVLKKRRESLKGAFGGSFDGVSVDNMRVPYIYLLSAHEQVHGQRDGVLKDTALEELRASVGAVVAVLDLVLSGELDVPVEDVVATILSQLCMFYIEMTEARIAGDETTEASIGPYFKSETIFMNWLLRKGAFEFDSENGKIMGVNNNKIYFAAKNLLEVLRDVAKGNIMASTLDEYLGYDVWDLVF